MNVLSNRMAISASREPTNAPSRSTNASMTVACLLRNIWLYSSRIATTAGRETPNKKALSKSFFRNQNEVQVVNPKTMYNPKCAVLRRSSSALTLWPLNHVLKMNLSSVWKKRESLRLRARLISRRTRNTTFTCLEEASGLCEEK